MKKVVAVATVLLLAAGRPAVAQDWTSPSASWGAAQWNGGYQIGSPGSPGSYQPGQVAVSTAPAPTTVYYSPQGQPTVVNNQAPGTYQPGQVAVTGIQQGAPTYGGTTTVTNGYNGVLESNGQGAESFASAYGPSPLGLTGNQGAYYSQRYNVRQYAPAYIQGSNYGSANYNYNYANRGYNYANNNSNYNYSNRNYNYSNRNYNYSNRNYNYANRNYNYGTRTNYSGGSRYYGNYRR